MKPRSALFALLLLVVLLSGSPYGEESASPVTAILGAFDEEVAMLEGQLRDRQEKRIMGIPFLVGELSGRQVVVAQTGVGKVNAGMVATLLIEHFQPSEVLFSGIAGGINPDLLPGDIVIAATTAQHDLGTLSAEGMEHQGVRNPIDGKRNPALLLADERLLEVAIACGRRLQLEKMKTNVGERTPRVVLGTVVTGDVFVTSEAKKRELRETLQADAVEMEGAAVAQVCWQLGVPCLVIRSLSDRADANAARDCERFYKIGARNSARLVLEMLGQLSRSVSPPLDDKAHSTAPRAVRAPSGNTGKR